MDLTILLQSAPQLLRDLPLIINVAQLIFYAGLALSFGGVIMHAYRGHLPGYMRFAGRLVFGFLAVITGIGISWLIPQFSGDPIYVILQGFLNVIPGGIISTVVLFFTLRMMSYHVFNIRGIEKDIEKLGKMKERAMKIEHEEKARNRHGIRHPVRIAGLAAFAAFLVIGLVGFSGFPSITEGFGLEQEDLDEMADQMEMIGDVYGDRISEITNSECISAMTMLQDAELTDPQPYDDPDVRDMIEEYAGEGVVEMYRIEAEGESFIMALTATQSCISTMSSVCSCQPV